MDCKINKSINKRILYLLKKLKSLLTFYCEKKNLKTKYPLTSIQDIKIKTIRESNLVIILSKHNQEKLLDYLKNTNTFYLYLQKKNFRDKQTQQKYNKQEQVLEHSMALSKSFPINIVSQIYENEHYTVQEITRDKRGVDFESYFLKGESY